MSDFMNTVWTKERLQSALAAAHSEANREDAIHRGSLKAEVASLRGNQALLAQGDLADSCDLVTIYWQKSERLAEIVKEARNELRRGNPELAQHLLESADF